MANHWPLLAATMLIALAAALGLWQHDQAVSIAGRSDSRTAISNAVSAPPAPPAEPAIAPEKAPPPAAAGKPAPAPAVSAPAAPTTSPAAKTPPVATTPVPGAAPAPAPAAGKTVPVTGAPPIVRQIAPPSTAPAVPAAAAAPAASREKLLMSLRGILQKKLGVLSMELAAGGYALNVEGTRVEVQPMPNWSVNIYNINPKQAEVETDTFKIAMLTVAVEFGIDLAQKAVESANGKTYLQSSCKMGSVSVVRDPANGNSCMIRPIQTLAPAAPQVQPQPPAAVGKAPAPTQPAPPKTPPTPAPPVRVPATDANF